MAEDVYEHEEWIDIDVTHYADTAYIGTDLEELMLDGGQNTTRLARTTQNTNLLGWSHRLKFTAETSDTVKGMKPIGWGAQYWIERTDQ